MASTIVHCIEKGVFVLKVWHLKKHSHKKSFFSNLKNLALIDPQSLVSSIFHLLFHPRLVFHLLLWNLTEAHLLANLLGQKVDRVNHKHDWTWTIVNDDLVKSYCWKIIMSIEITDKWIWDKKVQIKSNQLRRRGSWGRGWRPCRCTETQRSSWEPQTQWQHSGHSGIASDVSHEIFLETNLYGCFQWDGNYLSPWLSARENNVSHVLWYSSKKN